MSFFTDYCPFPAFPKYSGPYSVGTLDVEIPVCGLQARCQPPNPDITTVSFRLFYPCDPHAKPAAVPWLPEPQRGYLSSCAKFLGMQGLLAELVAYFPQLPYYINIPAAPSAPLFPPPTKSLRWPLLMFSHGLGGTRTAYSHICGSLASHGIVVVAPEHRDGSATVSYVRDQDGKQTKKVDYIIISHKPCPEGYAARDAQLKIRLWELACIYDALLRLDAGNLPRNFAPNPGNADASLAMFVDRLNMHSPGSVIFTGHSFGAATVTQFVKSIYWQPSETVKSYAPLIMLDTTSPLINQITPSTPLILLDIWTLPLRSPSTAWLWEKALPCYSSSSTPIDPAPVLSILSEQFFKWRDNVQETVALLSPPPNYTEAHNDPTHRPRIFYPAGSAHLSQSDFGVLFPWLTKKIFKADEPERMLRLNVRAILQVLREHGTETAETSALDREDEKLQVEVDKKVAQVRSGDAKILQLDGNVRGWVAVPLADADLEDPTQTEKKTAIEAVVGAEVMKNHA